MRIAEIVVTAGTPRNEWCDTCLTSAYVVVDMHIVGADGPWTVSTAGGCERCGTGMFGPGGPLATT